MSKTLKSDLIGLKNRLEEIESQIESNAALLEVRQEKWRELNDEVISVIERNRSKNLITLNIGGKKFVTYKETLLSAKLSLFERLIESNRFDLANEIYIDRSPKYFPVLLEYIRIKKIDYTRFKDPELNELREEADYYNIEGICHYLEDRLKDVEFLSFEFSGPYIYQGKTAGTNFIDDLTDTSQKRGICTDTNGWITIELNAEFVFSEIEIGGFKGNSNLWYNANGSGAKIQTSVDGVTWKNVGNIPSSFGNKITSVKLTKSTGRYIKFVHNSYLGIGYLNIKKL